MQNPDSRTSYADYAEMGRGIGDALSAIADTLPVRPEWEALPTMPIEGERPIGKDLVDQAEIATQFGNYINIRGAAPWKPVTPLEQSHALEYFKKRLTSDGKPPWRPVHPMEKTYCHEFSTRERTK